jgi:hypothetical protein
MVQVAVRKPFEQVPQAALHVIDHIGLAEARQAESTALWATRVRPEMEPERPRHLLLPLA